MDRSIIAHRGASGYAPENTLAAFRKAFELGAKWVEFDVRICADGTPIICHDDTTTRTTNMANKAIINLPLIEIQKLDAGSWFAAEFAAEKIPTFAETLKFLAEHHMQPHIEIKSNPGYEIPTIERVLKEFNAIWPQNLAAIFSSFDVGMLRILRALDANVPIALAHNVWEPTDAAIIKELNCCAIHVKGQSITAAHVADIKKLGINILCYTIDQPEVAEQLFNLGVQGIFTNFPDRLAPLALKS